MTLLSGIFDIGANYLYRRKSHGTYISDDALYYLAGQLKQLHYPSQKRANTAKENNYDNLVVDVFI